MFQIIWSPLATETYLDLLASILENWSLEVAQKFDDQINALLDKLTIYNQLCPPSDRMPDLRKCTISEQTSLVYQIKGRQIELVAFFDNRGNHPY